MRGLSILPFCFVATAALAQDSIYIGLGLGSFDYQENFDSPFVGRVADKVSTHKLMGGFEFNEHFALEINYGKTSEIRESGTENVPPFGDVTDTLVMDFAMTSLTAVGQLPFEWGALLGGLGYFSSENDYTDTLSADCCNTVVDGGTFRDDGTTALLGIEWRFGRFGYRYALRLEYQWWDISAADASAVGLAFSYGF